MKMYVRIPAFALMVLLALRCETLSQNNSQECRPWGESLPCNLMTYSALVDPNTLPVVAVPIAVHIVRYGDHLGGFEGNLATIISTLNTKFSAARISFFLLSEEFIDSDYFASQDPPYTLEKEDALSAAYNVLDAVNVYIVPEYSGGTGTFTPDILLYLGREEQSIIISNTNANTSSGVPHEMGHYFNLAHTFESDCTNPTPTLNDCEDSPIINGTPSGTSTGDFVEDSEPEGGNGYDWTGDCQWNGGTLWCPDETNLMSYVFACRSDLTVDQIKRIRTTYEERRPELHKWYGRFTNKIGGQNPGGSFLVDGQSTVSSGSYYQFMVSGSHSVRTESERFIDFGGSTDYKHHDWNTQLNDFRLTHSFILPARSVLYPREANFLGMNSCIIRAELIDGGLGDQVKCRDPWRLHSDGTQPDALITWPSPHSPTGAYDQDSGGVFLSQDSNIPGNPHYSVGVESPVTISGFESHFIKWAGAGATFQDSFALETPVVFNASGATATALYKAHLGSSVSSASGSNSQRTMIVVRDAALSNKMLIANQYFLAYESGAEVWHATSLDQGSTWTAEERVSAGSGGFGAPSISVHTKYNHLFDVYSVYRKQSGSYRDIVFRVKDDGTWKAPVTVSSPSTISSSVNTRPVYRENN